MRSVIHIDIIINFDFSQHLYRAHQYSDGHQHRLKDHRKASTPQTSPPENEFLTDAPLESIEPCLIQRLVVFICDPTAHHSSLLSFRELVKSPELTTGRFVKSKTRGEAQAICLSCDLIELGFDPATSQFDRKQLEEELISCHRLQQKGFRIHEALKTPNNDAASDIEQPLYYFEVIPIVVLSAGSNVTGLQTDTAAINELVHRYNGITCWDFAAVSAHSKIDFNPADRPTACTDVGLFSPHKLLGGPGCPGILMIKKSLLHNAIPSVPGGGVIFYVSSEGHSYIHVS